MTSDAELARQVKRDYREAPLDAKTRALMDYAIRVTREPETLTGETIDGLRVHGWTDAEILTATEVIGFFNYYARMADALGVAPEEFMVRDPEVWPED